LVWCKWRKEPQNLRRSAIWKARK